jgi:hypothetical protein
MNEGAGRFAQDDGFVVGRMFIPFGRSCDHGEIEKAASFLAAF